MIEFPTVSAYGNTHGYGSEGLGNAGEGARASRPEGMGGNARASRAWKGNGCQGSPVSQFSFHKHSEISIQHSAGSDVCMHTIPGLTAEC